MDFSFISIVGRRNSMNHGCKIRLPGQQKTAGTISYPALLSSISTRRHFQDC
jgi:hypothetical protein